MRRAQAAEASRRHHDLVHTLGRAVAAQLILAVLAVTGLAIAAVSVSLPTTLAAAALAVATSTVIGLLALRAGVRAAHARGQVATQLERLYLFSRAVCAAPEGDDVVRTVLRAMRDVLGADYSEMAVFTSARGGHVRRTVLADDDLARIDTIDTIERNAPWLTEWVVGEGSPMIAARGTEDSEQLLWLQGRGFVDAISVPLRGRAGIIGVLTVANRPTGQRTFDEEDAELLEVVAADAAHAVRNGEQIERLRHEARHDELTRLPNRAHLQATARDVLRGVERGDVSGMALLLVDLNGFKEVNDTLGHQQGDELLVEVAGRFSDAAGGGALVSRLGGDEFAVLLPGVDNAHDAELRALRLLAALQDPIVVDDLHIEIGAAIGISLAPDMANEVEELLRQADVAMYLAKTGDDGVRVYDVDNDSLSPRRLELVAELREALANQHLKVHVQPQLDLATGRIIAVEALARWRHPARGHVSPEDFVEVAERNGLIRPLTLAVLEVSLAAVSSWQRWAGDQTPSIAVNLSPRMLLDPHLVQEVRAGLARHHVPAHLLTLEITESSVMTDSPRALQALHALRTLGVGLSVDDFGTGYSSLSYLRRLPVDEVKIDRSFVMGMLTESGSASIVRSIIDLGTNLGLTVVAEGVEEQAQLDRLSQWGCTRAQGYLISEPMPIADFPGWLSSHYAVGAPLLVPNPETGEVGVVTRVVTPPAVVPAARRRA